jgi:hypothetical protein
MNITEFDPSLGTAGNESTKVFVPGLTKFEAGQPVAAPAARSPMKQYMIVGGVVLVGVGLLLFLRGRGLGADLALGDEPKIDYPIDAPTNTQAEARQKQVMSDLTLESNLNAVPSEQIKQNPFELASITEDQTVLPLEDLPVVAAQKGPTAEELRLSELDRHASTLELNTVIAGRISLARINGKTYRVGDVIEETFEVTEITAERTVAIAADGHEWVLEMASH